VKRIDPRASLAKSFANGHPKAPAPAPNGISAREATLLAAVKDSLRDHERRVNATVQELVASLTPLVTALSRVVELLAERKPAAMPALTIKHSDGTESKITPE